MRVLSNPLLSMSLLLLFSYIFIGQAYGQGFYAGVHAGSSDFEGSQFGESEIGWGAYLGLDLVRFFGIELAYTDYQRFESRVPGQTQPNPTAISLSGIVRFPVLNRLDVYVKAGYANLDVDIDSSNPFYIGSRDEDTALYGIGLSYRLSDDWQLRLGAERMDMDLETIPAGSFFTRSEGDLDFLSIGLTRRF